MLYGPFFCVRARSYAAAIKLCLRQPAAGDAAVRGAGRVILTTVGENEAMLRCAAAARRHPAFQTSHPNCFYI